MRQTRKNRNHGFSLIELVIVVVIIGILAAVAVPRLSRGSAGAGDSALTSDLAVLRNALDIYATEHGGTVPTTANIVTQLTTYTDISGNPQATADLTHIYGPYLRKVPPLPVGTAKGSTGIAASAGAGVGWIYTTTASNSGTVTAATTTEADVTGTLYNTY